MTTLFTRRLERCPLHLNIGASVDECHGCCCCCCWRWWCWYWRCRRMLAAISSRTQSIAISIFVTNYRHSFQRMKLQTRYYAGCVVGFRLLGQISFTYTQEHVRKPNPKPKPLLKITDWLIDCRRALLWILGLLLNDTFELRAIL